MRQLDSLRQRLNARGQWLQVGLASATVVAPLVSRWNALRANERARALREEAEALLKDVRTGAPWARLAQRGQVERLAQELHERLPRERGRISTKLWLAGVGVGLVAAGTGAYFLVRRRMAESMEEPLVDLPLAHMNGNGSHLAESIKGAPEVTTTHATPGPTASAAAEAAAKAEVATAAPAPMAEEASEAPAASTKSIPASGEAEAAPFIGNIRTMVYHEAGTANLPAEENHIYFASEEEARAAGYRRHRDEVPAGEVEGETGSGEAEDTSAT